VLVTLPTDNLVPVAFVNPRFVEDAVVLNKVVPVALVYANKGNNPYPETELFVPEELVKFNVGNNPYPDAL
jgi:hypothetical protein